MSLLAEHTSKHGKQSEMQGSRNYSQEADLEQSATAETHTHTHYSSNF